MATKLAQKVFKETDADKIRENERRKMSEENPFMTQEELNEAGNVAVEKFAELANLLKTKEDDNETPNG